MSASRRLMSMVRPRPVGLSGKLYLLSKAEQDDVRVLVRDYRLRHTGSPTAVYTAAPYQSGSVERRWIALIARRLLRRLEGRAECWRCGQLVPARRRLCESCRL